METINVLDKVGIKHVGANNNIDEAKKAVILEKNGIKIGIVGYTDNEPGWVADTKKPGINYLKVGDIDKVKNDIRDLRGKVDILIVSIHWGPNMKEVPSEEFINFAHSMIDGGIDIIHGHSAHIVQGVEIYKKKLIMYDTGDFVDDYMVDSILRNDLSFFFKVEIDKNGIKKLILVPIKIDNMQVNLAKGKDKDFISSRIKELSKKFNTEFDNNLNVVIGS